MSSLEKGSDMDIQAEKLRLIALFYMNMYKAEPLYPLFLEKVYDSFE